MAENSYRNLLIKAIGILRESNIDNAEYDAKCLLMHRCDIDLQELALNPDKDIDKTMAEHYLFDIRKRAEHIPLQYITNSQNFYGLDYYVNESVLVPRYDTENIVDRIIRDYGEFNTNLRVLDMCTGSGCIAISLKKSGFGEVYAADISPKALEVASFNAKKHNVDITFIESDMFANINFELQFDIIVSNPPYIESDIIKTLDEEVRLYEPHQALDGGSDGLDFYRIILENAYMYLKKSGRLYLEIGHNQAVELSKIAEKNLFYDIMLIKDLAGLDRGLILSL